MAGKTGLGILKGTPLVGAITTVCSSAFLLFGYDQGVMSGAVISEYWLEAMPTPSTVIVGTITALYDVGAVFGAISAALTVESLGKKRGLLLGASLLLIGTILMGGCVERIQTMVGRIVTDLGMLTRHAKTNDVHCLLSYRNRDFDLRCTRLSERDLSSNTTRMASMLPTDDDALRFDAVVLDQLYLLLSLEADPVAVSCCLSK